MERKKVSISRVFVLRKKGPIIFYIESILDIGIYASACQWMLMHLFIKEGLFSWNKN